MKQQEGAKEWRGSVLFEMVRPLLTATRSLSVSVGTRRPREGGYEREFWALARILPPAREKRRREEKSILLSGAIRRKGERGGGSFSSFSSSTPFLSLFYLFLPPNITQGQPGKKSFEAECFAKHPGMRGWVV